MKLLIDAGNTRLKLGWLMPDGRREDSVGAFAHADVARQLPAWLAHLPQPPRSAIGVNVSGAASGERIVAILQEQGCELHWQRARAQALGLHNGYRDPAQLGPDRWAALLALWAHPRYRDNAEPATWVLATFGTATTIDTLTPNGRFEGGLILPGVALMLQSLAQGTADLPHAQGDFADFPRDTHQAITSGVGAAQAGAVLRQWLASRAASPAVPARLAVTGGAWPAVEHALTRLLATAEVSIPVTIMDNPVLDGLAMLTTEPTSA